MQDLRAISRRQWSTSKGRASIATMKLTTGFCMCNRVFPRSAGVAVHQAFHPQLQPLPAPHLSERLGRQARSRCMHMVRRRMQQQWQRDRTGLCWGLLCAHRCGAPAMTVDMGLLWPHPPDICQPDRHRVDERPLWLSHSHFCKMQWNKGRSCVF